MMNELELRVKSLINEFIERPESTMTHYDALCELIIIVREITEKQNL